MLNDEDVAAKDDAEQKRLAEQTIEERKQKLHEKMILLVSNISDL